MSYEIWLVVCRRVDAIPYLGQSDVRHNDDVQSTRGIPRCLAGISLGVILIFEMLGLVFVIVVDLPGHRALSDRDLGFRTCGGRFAAKVESCDREGTTHDRCEDLPTINIRSAT